MADLLERINTILTMEFASLEDLLAFYREVLPARTAGYHQEEVGPVMPHNRPGEAEKFVRKIFTLGEHTVDMSAGLDWYAAAEGDLEWNGGLVRHGYFTLLAEEYRKTGDERYAATIVEHMLDYIERVPPFDPTGKPYLEYKKSTWRPFEVAARAAETWPEALGKIIGSKSMTPEAWAKILLATHEHGRFLALHHWKTGNHACLEVAALGLLGIFYQEFKEAEEWREYASRFLLEIWPRQFHADGYTREMSGGYHWVAMRGFFTFYEVATRNGFAALFSPVYRERLVLNALAEFKQSKPDYSVPVTNDSNTGINRKEQLARICSLLRLPEVEYRLTGGRSGRKPDFTSCFLPEARIGIMRSDWTDEARYLFFDMGPWGENHMNEDQLSVEVSAYGRKFLVNCGRWRYTTSPDAPWMARAKYFKTTAACNSVLVDGYCQVPGDAEGYLRIHDGYDYAEGLFAAGYGREAEELDEAMLREKGTGHRKVCLVKDVVHKRQIIFVKPDFWILRDTITGPGEHEAEQVWHYYEGEVRAADGAMVTDFPDANLVLISLGDGPVEKLVFVGAEEPCRGWHCPSYDRMRPTPELSFKQKGTGRIVFHTLLFPVKGRIAALPVFEVTTRGYRVRYLNRQWEVLAPSEGEWSLV
ncbi:MAG: hypothetical protein GX493_03850 [Firmicutes bacterium]|nr:hypothetical protein [Bacillota bacterium]